jgi:hypothetical protein
MRLLRFILPFVLVATGLAGCTHRPIDQGCILPAGIQMTAPAPRLVSQRGLRRHRTASIAGICSIPIPNGIVTASLTPFGSTNFGPWQSLGSARADGHFEGSIRAPAGWYRLDVRVDRGPVSAFGAVMPVGVGEVFIVVGHSVGQGGDFNLTNRTDDRVNTIAWATNSAGARAEYERTARAAVPASSAGHAFPVTSFPRLLATAPTSGRNSRRKLRRSRMYPCSMLNAAFGGTSLEHWAKSARGERFEHSFVKSELRMPYVNLHHALRRYATVTGVRAILADRGQRTNSPETDRDKVVCQLRHLGGPGARRPWLSPNWPSWSTAPPRPAPARPSATCRSG